jgi:hypothetical protein
MCGAVSRPAGCCVPYGDRPLRPSLFFEILNGVPLAGAVATSAPEYKVKDHQNRQDKQPIQDENHCPRRASRFLSPRRQRRALGRRKDESRRRYLQLASYWRKLWRCRSQRWHSSPARDVRSGSIRQFSRSTGLQSARDYPGVFARTSRQRR